MSKEEPAGQDIPPGVSKARMQWEMARVVLGAYRVFYALINILTFTPSEMAGHHKVQGSGMERYDFYI